MVFQLDLKGAYHNIRMQLGNALKFVWIISVLWPLSSLKG